MARTTQEIYDDLVSQLTANTTLAPLAVNASKTAVWRLFLWIFAYGANILETLLDAFVSEVEIKGTAAKVGNTQWYRDRVLAFQYGDTLTYLNDIYQYAIIDPTKRIVTNCAVTEAFDPLIGGVLNIKVARILSGNLAALDSSQRAALVSYVQKVRFAGTKFKIISTDGDILKIGFDIYYDPITTLSIVRTNVIATINSYIKNLPFDGTLSITKLIDEIQKLEGVSDIVFVSAASKPNVGSGYSSFTRIKNAYGGYFVISTASGEDLMNTLNFIAV